MVKNFHGRHKIFILVAVAIFMSTMDAGIVNVALPYIMQDLSGDMSAIQWVVVIYLLTVSSLLLTFGRLSDIRGRAPVYISGFMVFTLGSFFCGMAGSVFSLVGARVVQGIGASMLMACSPALVVDAFDKKSRGRVLGMVGAVVAVGLTVGPAAGGLILEYFSWRAVFYINIPMGLAACLAALFFLSSSSKGSGEPLDRIGAVLMPVVLCSLIAGITQSGEWGIFSWRLAGCLALGLAAGAGFIFNSRQHPFPLFDPALLEIRLFILPLAASCILFASLFILIFMMPFYFGLVQGYPPGRTGLVMVTPFIMLLVVSPLAGVVADRQGSRWLCVSGMLLLGYALISLAGIIHDTPLAWILWRLAFAGVGTGLFVSPNNTAIMGAVPIFRRGIASGAVATARNLGMVVGVAIAGAVFTHTFTRLSGGYGLEAYTDAMAHYFMTGFRYAMLTGGGLALVGVFVSFARGSEGQVI